MVSVVSIRTGTGTSSPISVSAPVGGWGVGNLLVAGLLCTNTGADSVPVLPSGWTNQGTDSVNSVSRVCTKLAAGESNFSFTDSGGAGIDSFCALIIELSGINGAAPVNAVAAVDSGNNKSGAFNSITTTVDNCLILSMLGGYIHATGATFSTPAGAVGVGGVEADGSVWSAYFNGWTQTQATHGVLTPGGSTITTTATAAQTFWGGYVLAIAPSVVGTGVKFRRTFSEISRVGSRQRIGW